MPPASPALTPDNPAGNSASVRTRRIREIARDVLGFEEFRPGQERAMQSVVSGRDTLAVLPSGCTPVVFHTAVLAYLEPDRRAEFVALVDQLGVRWIAQEAAGIVPGIDRALAGPESFVLSVDGRPVAVTAPHGGRIDWL